MDSAQANTSLDEFMSGATAVTFAEPTGTSVKVQERASSCCSNDSFDKALMMYIIAALCFVIMVVLTCKYVICKRKVKALSRTSVTDGTFSYREESPQYQDFNSCSKIVVSVEIPH